MDRSLREIIQATGELPALPATTARLLRLMDDEFAGAREILEVIGQDPALTANLLKLCNSAYYGLRREVGAVGEALTYLGSRTVVQLAFATSLGDVLRGPLAGYRLERGALWRHSLAVAVGAAHLAGAGDRGGRERAFTAGLVHDIGKLVLNGPLKARLQQLPQTGHYDALRQGERELLGFDHTEAGQALAEAWNFPPSLAAVIGRHHDLGSRPGEGEPDAAWLVPFVAVANLAASRAGHGAGSACDDDAWQAALAALGVAPAEAEAMVVRIPADVGALSAALEGRP